MTSSAYLAQSSFIKTKRPSTTSALLPCLNQVLHSCFRDAAALAAKTAKKQEQKAAGEGTAAPAKK